MNYPFLYHVITRLDPAEIRKNLIYSGEKIEVWGDWQLVSVSSDGVTKLLAEKFEHLKLFKNQVYISKGSGSNFHIDRFYVHHLLHRVLIPLSENFSYQWIQNEKEVTYSPKAGEVILFNNMVPHRFFSENRETREVIYFDLYDPLVEKILPTLKGDYSIENGLLEKKYGSK